MLDSIFNINLKIINGFFYYGIIYFKKKYQIRLFLRQKSSSKIIELIKTLLWKGSKSIKFAKKGI